MKKIILLVLCCMMLSVGVCSAKILTETDKFTGGETITSIFKCDSSLKHNLGWISLDITKIKESINYRINGGVTTFKEFGLSARSAQINIDGDLTYDLPVLNRQIMRIVGEYLYMLDYQISKEVIDKLKTANRVALRFTQNSGSTFVYVLPDEVLAEWKQVINTTE